jgi:hypothetical protein
MHLSVVGTNPQNGWIIHAILSDIFITCLRKKLKNIFFEGNLFEGCSVYAF